MSEKPTGSKSTGENTKDGETENPLFGAAAEKRRADQNATNTDWLIKKIDAAHALLCPRQIGTWQQRAEQVVEAAQRVAAGTYDSLSASDYRKLAAWFADPERKPATIAFTAGAARDAARAFEDANRR